MKLTREELLRQRGLVEEQLRWIDAKLAEASTEETVASPAPITVTPTPQAQPMAVAPDRSVPTLAPKIDFASDGSGEGVTTGQKIGCLVLVIIFCLGVLGMIFILPYLLY